MPETTGGRTLPRQARLSIRMALSGLVSMLVSIPISGLGTTLALTPAGAQGLAPVPTLKDCEQDDVASLAVRACTHFLAQGTLDSAERLRLLNLRGRSWLTEDDPESAAEDFTQALKIEPGNRQALTGRVRAYDLLEKFDLAVADWSALIAQSPKDDKLYRSRGASLLGAKKFAEAIADYDTSLALNPAGLDAYIGRALVYEAMTDRAMAMKQFDLGIAINPQYLPLFWERARMADRWGEKQMAINDYIMVLKINGQWANARKHLERLGVYSPY